MVGLSVGLSVTLSLKLRKTAEFTVNRCSLRERTTNQGSGSIYESRTQVNHSLKSFIYTSQGTSLAYVGLVFFGVDTSNFFYFENNIKQNKGVFKLSLKKVCDILESWE